mgnify:CR=1 FL=1
MGHFLSVALRLYIQAQKESSKEKCSLRIRAFRPLRRATRDAVPGLCRPLQMRINSRKAEGKTGKQEKRTGERADPQESEHERQTESQNESASS